MIPQTAAALVGFLFFVTPGILFETIRERRRPSLVQSPFREASRITLASLGISLLALLLLAALRASAPASMPDPGRWLREGSRYVLANYQLIVGFFLAELALAAGLAVGAARLLVRGQPATIRQVSAWYSAFRVQRPHGATVFVRVLMADGVEYYGVVVGYTTDYQLADRELQLASPLYRRLPGEHAPSQIRSPWSRIIVPGTAIHGIWVSYLSNQPAPTLAPAQPTPTDQVTGTPNQGDAATSRDFGADEDS